MEGFAHSSELKRGDELKFLAKIRKLIKNSQMILSWKCASKRVKNRHGSALCIDRKILWKLLKHGLETSKYNLPHQIRTNRKKKSIDKMHKNQLFLGFLHKTHSREGKLKLTRKAAKNGHLHIYYKGIFWPLIRPCNSVIYIYWWNSHLLSIVNFSVAWQKAFFMLLYSSNFRVFCAKTV